STGYGSSRSRRNRPMNRSRRKLSPRHVDSRDSSASLRDANSDVVGMASSRAYPVPAPRRAGRHVATARATETRRPRCGKDLPMGFEVSGKLHAIFDTQQVTERFRKREFVLELGDKPR